MAYLAGGIDILDREQPTIILIKSLSFLQKLPVFNPINVPFSALVDAVILKPLIKGTRDVLKPFLAAKQDGIQRDVNHNALVNLTQAFRDEEQARLEQREIPIWAMLMHAVLKTYVRNRIGQHSK